MDTFSYTNCSSSHHEINASVFYRYPSITGGVILAGKVCTTVTSILSIFGVGLIVFTYIAYKDLRTRARTMLLHLSIADFIIVVSHIVSIYANYERFILKSDMNVFNTTNKDKLCLSQAAFTTFGTLASFLWSNAIGFFMVMLIVNHERLWINKVVYVISCLVCWLIPLLIVICDASLQLFGFVTIGSTGCYILNIPTNEKDTKEEFWAELISYDLWLYLTFLLLPILYAVLFYYTRCKFKPKKRKSYPDMKLLLVPLIFLLLRIWSAISGFYTVYVTGNNYKCSKYAAGITIINGIGINAQGLANGLLFCVLTPPIRKKLWHSFIKCNDRVRNCLPSRKYDQIHESDKVTTSNLVNLSYTESYGSINP